MHSYREGKLASVGMNSSSVFSEFLGEWRNHNGVHQREHVAYLLVHPTQVESFKIHEEMSKIWACKVWEFLVENGKSQNTWNYVNGSLITKEPIVDNYPTPIPSSNTVSMQSEQFLLNKHSQFCVWLWFKLKSSTKSMDMGVTIC